MDSTVLNKILDICLPILVPFVVGLLVAATRAFWAHGDAVLEQKYGTRWEHVKDVIHEAMHYAEQVGLDKQLEKSGEQKLALATDYAKKQLQADGISLDVDSIVALIKSSVQQEFNYDKEVSPATPAK